MTVPGGDSLGDDQVECTVELDVNYAYNNGEGQGQFFATFGSTITYR